MRKTALVLFLFSALAPQLWGADSVVFKCTSQLIDAKDFQTAVVNNNDMVDLGKASVIPGKLNCISSFSFAKNGLANCAYSIENKNSQIFETKKFVYPGTGDNSTVTQLEQKFRTFVIPLRLTGVLQYEQLMSGLPLKTILSGYTKLPTSPQDRYLQFKKEDIASTTTVVTDSNEEKVLYRIVIPKTVDDPHVYEKLIDNFKNGLKSQGKTDAQIALLLPDFQKVVDGLKSQTQALMKRHQFAQFETYTYEP